MGAFAGELRSLFFFQAEDGIRGLVRSRGLGDVYKRQRFERDFGKKKASSVQSLGKLLIRLESGAEEIRILSLIHI